MRPAGIIVFLLGILAFLHLQGQYSPPGSPQYRFNRYSNEAGCPYVFLATYRVHTPFILKGTNMLLGSDGDLVWYQQEDLYALDFELHADGRMAYNDNHRWHILDSTFAEVDSVQCVGYRNDIHELRITADGHYFLVCMEDSVMDLSSLMTTGGFPGAVNGRVDGVVVQELDAGKNVVREWHGLDHYQIQDVDTAYFQNPSVLELTHTNSIDLAPNGKMLLSHRSRNEVTQIDWQTGAIDWKLGGKQNEFDLQGDPGLIGQHDARYLGNGRISIFDNGNLARPARGIVYGLDTMLMQARLEASFSDAGTMSDAMGSFRMQADGSAMVGMGRIFPTTQPYATYFAADSSKVFEISSPDSTSSYRAICSDLPWALDRPQLNCADSLGLIVLGVAGLHTDYQWTTGENTATIVVADTGWYQAFVPRGIGMMSTEPYHIVDLNNACLALTAAPTIIRQKQPILIGTYDLLGRPAPHHNIGEVYIERYNDGSSRKVVQMR